MSAFAWLRDMSYHIECTSSRLLNLHQLGECALERASETGGGNGREEGHRRGARKRGIGGIMKRKEKSLAGPRETTYGT